jgi:diguanylate cyclase (GGDEF)-like protein
MTLHLPTIAVIGLLLYFGIAVGFSLVMLMLRGQPVPRLWAASLWAAAINTAMFGLPLPIPEAASILIRNGFGMLSSVLMVAGVAMHVGRRPPWRAASALGGAYLLGIAWFSLVTPDLGTRLLMYGVVLTAFKFWEAWLLLRHAPAELRVSCRLAATVFLLDAALFLLRGLLPTAPDAGNEVMRAGLPIYIGYIGGLFVILAQTFALMILLVERQLVELRRLARTDELTGALNRAALLGDGQHQLALCQRQQRPFSALLLDLDFFKRINDTWGHQAGDDALRHSFRTLRDDLRSYDVLFGRYGGEEFVLFLPGVAMAQACALAERLRATLAAHPLVRAEQPAIPLTVSIGVSEATVGTSLDPLLARADAALYRAKAGGRNRVVCDEPTTQAIGKPT